MGILKVTGTLALDQFWPQGSSDADTTKVVIGVNANSFQFQQHPSAPFVATRVFQNALVQGRNGRKPPIDKKSRITVRQQGIDAAELHYRPSPLGKKKPSLTATQLERFKSLNKEYRQHLGETATVALHKMLSRAGTGTIPCVVLTHVKRPTDVFDTYARFVGDIQVTINGRHVNVNQWLVRQGWAFPAFYNSMTDQEIADFLTAMKVGQKQPGRLWKNLKAPIGKFDETLRYRGKNAALDPQADKGALIMPKLFRRLCTWSIYRKSGFEKTTFKQYLTANSNVCYLLDDFLENGLFAATPRNLHEFLSTANVFKTKPHQLVFKEDPSKLLGPDGKEVLSW